MERSQNFEKLDSKREKIKELIPEDVQAVVVLSGAMRLNPVTNQFESGSYAVTDDSGLVTGGKDRVIAASTIAESFPEKKIITTSRTRDPLKPTYAEVMARELEELGVAREAIIIEDIPVDTITGLKASLQLAEKNDWNKIAILSGGYHLARVKEMLENIVQFCDESEREQFTPISEKIERGELAITFIAAEDILKVRNKHYDYYFSQVEKSPGYKKRVEAEVKGIQDLRDGKYFLKK